MSDIQNTDSLSNLLEKSKQLASSSKTLPKSLMSLYSQSKKLSSEYGQADGAQSAYLLGRHGFDVKKYKGLLKKLKLKGSAFETQEPLFVTDIHGYLQHEHQMTILTSIEEAKKQSQSMFYSYHNYCVDENWRKAKSNFQNLLATKGIEKSQFTKWEPVNDSQLTQSSIGTRGKSSLNIKMQSYANVIFKLNQTGNDSLFPIIQELRKVAENVDDNPGRRQEIIECWKLLSIMFDEERAIFNASIRPYEAYSNPSNYGQGEKSKIEEKFILGSLKYLEEQYLNHIREICFKYAYELNLNQDIIKSTSSQAIKSLIEAYVKHRFYIPSTGEWRVSGISDNTQGRIQLSHGKPLWELIFFSIRCGKHDIALEYANEFSGSAEQDIQILSHLLKLDNPTILDEAMQSQLAQKYRTSEYVFKKAVLLILGKLNIDDGPRDVFQKLEDYIWQKLMLIPNRKLAFHGNQASLLKLQEQITKLGPSYFIMQKNRSSLIYFKLLLILQEFERAIEYLCGRDLEGFGVEVVHFALALDYYGVLRTTQSMNDPIMISSNQGVSLNLSFIIRDYVRKFVHTDPREAVSYICRISNQDHRVNSLSDLVIESKDISSILGSFTNEGLRNKGIIEKMIPKNEFISILKIASDEYEKIGKFESAIDLHFIAADSLHGTPEASKHLSKVLKIITDELSRALSLNTSDKYDTVKLALQVKEKTSRIDSIYQEWFILELLLQLNEFFEDVKQNKFEIAFEKIRQMRILPLGNLGIEETYKNFTILEPAVKDNIADSVIETMRCLQGLSRQYNDFRNQKIIQSCAADLLEFARKINDQTSKRIYEIVIQFDLYFPKNTI